MADPTYGTGLGLGDAIRQRRKTIAELSGAPYEPDVMEQWKSNGVITPEQTGQMAKDVATAIKFGKGAVAGAKAGAIAYAPTMKNAAGRAMGMAGKLARPVLAAGRQAKDSMKLAQAFYRKLQGTAQPVAQAGGRMAQTIAPKAKKTFGDIMKRTYATAE
jgi:hypothetical protein